MNTYSDRFRMEEMFRQIMERFDKVDLKLDASVKTKHPLDGDTLLDNQDMCQLLKVCNRTLTNYRLKKLIPYYILDGKAYYKASEVQDFLKRKGKL